MTQQYVPNLGEIPGPDAHRDAVHIAVAPVMALGTFAPGTHVGLYQEGSSTPLWDGLPQATTNERPIGIVDPFLKSPVGRGQRFWLWLYPNTVTSLRHVWSHPAFTAQLPTRDVPDTKLPTNEEAHDHP